MKKIVIIFTIGLILAGTITYTQIANADDEKYFFKVTLLNRLGYRAGVIEPLAEIIPAQLKLIGIDCESVFLESAAFREREYFNDGKTWDEGGMDMLTLAPGTSPPWVKSAGFWWSTDALVYAQTNPAQFSNGRFDELLNAATSERDPVTYKEQVNEMQQILYDEAPWIPLYFPVSGIPMVKELEGFRGDAGYSRYWTVDTNLAGTSEADDVTVIWAVPSFTPAFLPSLGRGSRLQAPIFDSMFIKGPEGFETDLIESYDVSEDGLTWIIKIPDNVKWHDGTPMTSKDIKFTFDLKMNKDFEGYESGYFQGWKPIEIVDDYTIRIVLEDFIFADLMKRTMEDMAGQVVPEHIMKDVPIDAWSSHWMYTGIDGTPIGNGPWKFEKFVPDQYAEFVANDDYWRGRPLIDRLIIKIVSDPQVALVELENGDVHVLDGTYYGYGREIADVEGPSPTSDPGSRC
jgi:ABC-type transport system substrate-binding protein